MAVSLEVRPVFLHPDMLELAGRIPPEQLATRRQGKHALKRALEPWLPQELLYRPKAGFAMPLGAWLSEDVLNMSAAAQGADPLAEIIDPAFVERLAQAHRTGRVDATASLHAFAFLRQWLTRWL
jgi:asparagine synthase (glutamine-hydrolysing)